jgi:hypothetical protein
MATYKSKVNPFTGKLQKVLDAESLNGLNFKPGVANAAALPMTGNLDNDARITNDNHHLYVWNGVAWVDQGDILDITWESISGGPTATPTEIDNVVLNSVTSDASGDYHKVTKIRYNPTTGEIQVLYEV